MSPDPRRRRAVPASILLILAAAAPAHAALPKVPEGFEARLVAAVPAVVYPIQLATAPDGSLFVAEDPMDQVGPYESFHGRILLFRDGKDPVVFAEGFRAVQGMAWHDGALYVSHMPFLTVVRDADGDGKAESKVDLFKDLGPTNNQGLNDHIVSGIQFGIDGRLYISVGDKGVPKATGPDGRVVQLKGGGTLRCKPDGTELEVLTSGTRNHLEANLDDRDNLFTYDNTDDGDGWWTRVTHHVAGGYYGYPFDYHDRPDRMLPRMAEYGGGSPCGAAFYKEDIWPEKYRNVGFWAEWGKGKVHAFKFAPDGSTFKVAEAIDFAVPQDGLDFRPIDLAVSFDGRTLYVADWGMGSWGKKDEKVGRVFAITYKGEVKARPRGGDADPIDAQFKQLDHPSFNERMRAQAALIAKGRADRAAASTILARITRDLTDARNTDPVARRHEVWVADALTDGVREVDALVTTMLDPATDVRAQFARALGEKRIAAGRENLVSLLSDPEPAVRLQAAIALGRIGGPRAAQELLPHLADSDPFVAFSTRQALRRIGDWPATAAGLASADAKVRAGVLATLEGVYALPAVEGLARFSADSSHAPEDRARAIEYLAVVHRKAQPWDGKWWGTRPSQGKPPAKVDDWEGTKLVLETVRKGLTAPDAPVRAAAVVAVVAEGDREALPALRARLADEPDANARREVALALGKLQDKEALPALAGLLRDPNAPEPVREAALTSLEAIGSDVAAKTLGEVLAGADVPADRQPRLIRALGKLKAADAAPLLASKLTSPAVPVRIAAAEALGNLGKVEGVAPKLRALLDDPDTAVRKAAIAALADLKDREAIPALLKCAEADATRFEGTVALAALPDARALHLYLRGLGDKSPDLRKSSASALGAIRAEAAPALDELAARKELSPALLPELRKVFAGIQPVPQWRVLGPFASDAAPPSSPDGPVDVNAAHVGLDKTPVTWKLVRARRETGEVDLQRVIGGGNRSAFAYAEIQSPADRTAQFAVGSDDTLTVWVNGKEAYKFTDNSGFNPERDRFDAPLVKGTNRLLVKCGNDGGPWAFSVAVSSADDYAFLKGPATGGFDPDAFAGFARSARGNPEHGRALFADLKGLACVKCHAVGGEGGNVGPDLSGIGARYPREELITSVLNPSAKIFPGYEPLIVATGDGRTLTGIVKVDTPDGLEIQDADGKRIRLERDDVEARKVSTVSLMPAGLAEGLTPQDFADLIGYLEGLKEDKARASGGR